MRLFWPAVLVVCVVTLSSSQEHPANAQPTGAQSASPDNPKVFITDSQSWETLVRRAALAVIGAPDAWRSTTSNGGNN